MANSWTLTVIVLLSIFMARSETKVFTEQSFILGNNVTLRCGNITDLKLNELIYIVWNISMQGRKCWLGLSPKLDNTCNDGKRLNTSSDGVSLFIPNISIKDEGFYSCDVSYKGGSYAVNLSVSVNQFFTRLENENSQMFAVCQATSKKTAPTLHWEPALNYSYSISSVKDGTSFLVVNRLYLPYKANISELTCVATYTSESGSVQQKSTLHLITGPTGTTSKFCLKVKEDTPTKT